MVVTPIPEVVSCSIAGIMKSLVVYRIWLQCTPLPEGVGSVHLQMKLSSVSVVYNKHEQYFET